MYHMNRIILIVITAILLTGCSIGGEKKIKIFSIEEPRAKLDYPMPDALILDKVRWIVITSDNAEEVFAKMKENKTDPVIFGLSDEDYELISKNFAQIRAYMIQQNQIIDEYKKYYESEDSSKK